MALNGLPAVSVARPHRWRNDWEIGSTRYVHGSGFAICSAVEDAIAAFKQCVDWDPRAKSFLRTEDGYLEIWGGYGPEHRNQVTARRELAGKNLACFCALDKPCHADVLLEIANRPICDEVQ